MGNAEHLEWLHEGAEAWNAKRESRGFTPDFSDEDLHLNFKLARKLDEDGNIPLSNHDLGFADFRGSGLCNWNGIGTADLRNSKLWSADFRDSRLINAKLDGAIVVRGQLQGAVLSGASLRGAALMSAILDGSDLSHTDLSDANLQLAHLGKSSLSHANLSNANLTTANLTGADLTCSRPWKAKLFPESEGPSTPSIDGLGRQITGIGDLIEAVSKLSSKNDFDGEIYFRGEAKRTWELRPCVMRKGADGVFKLRTAEGRMLIDLMTQRPEDFRDAPTALDQWMLAQHYGLKTRLLDITRNPLVALCGACGGLSADTKPSTGNVGRLHVFPVPRELIKPFNSDSIAILANFAKLTRSEQDCLLGWTLEEMAERTPNSAMQCNYEVAMQRLYHLIRQERPHFMERIDPRDFFRVFVVEPRQSFERLRVQSSAFLLSGFHERFERAQILKWNEATPTYDHFTLEVPASAKPTILEELRLLNITREALFPGLDEAAKAITGRYAG